MLPRRRSRFSGSGSCDFSWGSGGMVKVDLYARVCIRPERKSVKRMRERYALPGYRRWEPVRRPMDVMGITSRVVGEGVAWIVLVK